MKKFLIFLIAVVMAFTASPVFAAQDGPPYSVKDGRVYADGEELDAEVYEAPKGLDNGIKYWAALEGGDESETGVWFFTSDGQANGFIPLDSPYEYQDLLWSPDGGQLLLATGSGMRADMFFTLYGEGMEQKVEIPGVRGSAAWVDPLRFVLTRIDDPRADEDGVILEYESYKTSAVLYDSAADDETILGESSGTQDFAIGEVTDDGKIVIIESYVDSPKDWADEDKIKTRETTVEVPAAG